jgi:hypothetical protein
MKYGVETCLFSLLAAGFALAQMEESSRTTIIIPPGAEAPVAEPVQATPVVEVGFTGLGDNPAFPVRVQILSPQHQEVLPDNPVDIFFSVENYTLAEAGNRLHVIIDNEAPRPIWNLKRPLTLRNLPEGGHSIRVLAVRPDGLGLPDPTAFAMATFFLRRKGFENFMPDGSPILTVNQPGNGFVDLAEGEPVWFDFRTVNAPLSPGGGYSIQYRLNKGEGMITDEKPIFWTQVKPGRYELTATLVDQNQQPLPGVFNKVARTFEVRLAQKAVPVTPVPGTGGESRPPQP